MSKITILEFWASWCVPCKQFEPIFDEVAKEYDGRLEFRKVNADEEQALREQYEVTSIPSVLIIEDEIVKANSIGFMTKAKLKEFIDNNI